MRHALPCLLLALAAPAAADTWAVVPVGLAEAPARAVPVAEHAAATLQTSGSTVLQSAQLDHRVENALSLPFDPTDPGPLAQQLAQAEEQLAEAVALRRHAEVVAQTDALFAQARERLAALHRQPEASADLANLCGYRVRAFLENRDQAGATEATRQCFALIPGFTPDRGLHTPPVLELVARVRGELEASLVISASPDDPPGCAVRVHGVRVGETPSARVAVPPGAYDVQVECGSAPSRMHRVQASSGETSVRVRASLDAALRSRPVALVYAAPSALASLAGDVADLGRALGADHVLAVVEQPAGVVLRAFEIPDGDEPARQVRETFLQQTDEARVRESVAQLASALGNPSPASPSGGGAISPIGPIVLGVGGAAMIAAAIVGGISLAQASSVSSMCADPARCPPSLRPAYEEMRAFSGVADGLFVGGLLVATLGVVLTFTVTDGSGVAAAAACDGRGCAATLRGRF